MKIKIFKICLIWIVSFGALAEVSAQKSQNSAEQEFDDYERNLFQTPRKTVKPEKRKKKKLGAVPKPPKGRVSSQSIEPPISSIGSPGMKIWVERQTGCRGPFTPVAPTAVFSSGDCLRMRFRLNFEGFLSIINLGTSGKNDVIFPADNQTNRIFPKTDNYLPDNEGWQFDENPGNEQFVFIVSQSEINQAFVDGYLNNQNLVTSDSKALEVYDRDVKPRTEKDSVYVLANDARLEKPLVFRMTVRHR